MKKSKFITEFKDIPSPREKMPHLPSEERKENFREVELGFSEEVAVREARRCLSCRRCIGCGLCLAECDPRAVVYDDGGRTLKLKVDSVILTPGFEEFDAGRIGELGYRKCQNVITSIELERMLSPTGPYGGYVLRPFDGRVPGKIAFVQCVGSRNEAIGADFCSSICCMTALKEALALARLIPDVNVNILHRDMRPLGKGSEQFYQDVLKEKNVRLTRAAVTKVSEVAETGNLTVEVSAGGNSSREEYDLVVLSVGVRAAGKALSRRAGVRLNKYGFCITDSLSPGVTSKKGILSAGAFTAPAAIDTSVLQSQAVSAVALRELGGGDRFGGGSPGSDSGKKNPETKPTVKPSAGPEVVAALVPAGDRKPILVIGGGLAGLVAANELSRMGHRVTVAEKQEEIGGVLSKRAFKIDEKAEKDAISVLIEGAEAGGVEMLTSAQIKTLTGNHGNFSATLIADGKERTAEFAAVIVSIGGREYVPEGFLHGKSKNVLTQLELEQALADEPPDGSSFVMIQCVGSRASEWPVCSRVCCAQALKNALALKKARPEARITILHRDVRVYSVEEEMLSEALEKGIEFVVLKNDSALVPSGSEVKVRAGARKADGGDVLSVEFERAGGGKSESLSADCVVLSAALRPQTDVKELGETLGIEVDETGFFKEAHPKLRPVESTRKGVYICGLAHSPQTVSDTIIQATAAAKKAATQVSE